MRPHFKNKMITFYFRRFQKLLGLHQIGSVLEKTKQNEKKPFTIYYNTESAAYLPNEKPRDGAGLLEDAVALAVAVEELCRRIPHRTPALRTCV